MRRGAELVTFVLLAFGGCEGERVDPIDVQVELANPSVERSTTFEVECDPAEEESAVCAEIRRAPEIYFPPRLRAPAPRPQLKGRRPDGGRVPSGRLAGAGLL
jgi:hypothetical protein